MTAVRWAACALVVLSTLTVEASPVEPFLRGRQTQEDDSRRDERISNEGGTVPTTVRIHAFELDLQGDFPETPTEGQVRSTLEDFLNEYVGKDAEDQGMQLEDVFLASVSVSAGRRKLQESSLGVAVSGGVAYFATNEDLLPVLTEAELEESIATGLEQEFPNYVNANVQGATVDTAAFTSSTQPPTSAPLSPSGLHAPEMNTDNSKKKGIIAAGATGAFLGILIVAAALLVRHRRGPSLDEFLERGRGDSAKDSATHIESSLRGGEEGNIGNSASGETSSAPQQAQDDSSQWTLSTYPEDANTVMTFATGKSVVTNSNVIDRTESFERDRQVSLRKDMLNTSPGWNATDASIDQGKKVDDTVLQPSHFVTADEMPSTANNAPPTARFAANDEGEEIYLLPPSSIRGPKLSFREAG